MAKDASPTRTGLLRWHSKPIVSRNVYMVLPPVLQEQWQVTSGKDTTTYWADIPSVISADPAS